MIRAAATVDRAVAAAVVASQKRRPTRMERLSHPERVAEFIEIRDAYGDPRFLAEPDTFFPVPRTPDVALTPGATLVTGVPAYDASWPSPFEPLLPTIGGRYTADPYNNVAHARLYLHREPRPTAILIHGYLTGSWRFEERVWPIRWIYDRLGLDVALVALPFHGLRADPERRGPPPFPAADPRLTVEAFRHAVYDLRSLTRWLRERGAPDVGVLGMSLGGYTSALLATVEPSLAFVVPLIPLACLADSARDTGRLGRGHERDIQHRSYAEAHHVVSPFARSSRVPSERVLVVGATGDCITPLRHAERIAEHFDARLETFPGSHLVHVGIRSSYRAVAKLLRDLDIAQPVAPRAAVSPVRRISGFFRKGEAGAS